MASMSRKHGLSAVGNTKRGKIRHMTIEPMKTGSGGQGFVSRTHFNRHPTQEAKMQAGGPYTPEPDPEEVMHPDGQDMVDHVKSKFGIKDDDGDQDED